MLEKAEPDASSKSSVKKKAVRDRGLDRRYRTQAQVRTAVKQLGFFGCCGEPKGAVIG